MEHEPSSGKQAQAIYKHYSVLQNILYCIKNIYLLSAAFILVSASHADQGGSASAFHFSAQGGN